MCQLCALKLIMIFSKGSLANPEDFKFIESSCQNLIFEQVLEEKLN